MLSLWVTFLPQRSSSVALRALFSFARVGSDAAHCSALLVELTFGTRSRHALTCSFDWYDFTKAFKIGGSEVTVSSSCVGSHCITLLCRFGGALRRREKQARSDVLSLWVTYLSQHSSAVAMRALFLFARVGSQRRTLLSLVGEAHLRHERQARSDVLSRLV